MADYTSQGRKQVYGRADTPDASQVILRRQEDEQAFYGRLAGYAYLEQPDDVPELLDEPPPQHLQLDRPESAPPLDPVPAKTTQEMLYLAARYGLYGGIGYLIADQFLGGRGLIGAGVGVAGGWLAERTASQYFR